MNISASNYIISNWKLVTLASIKCQLKKIEFLLVKKAHEFNRSDIYDNYSSCSTFDVTDTPTIYNWLRVHYEIPNISTILGEIIVVVSKRWIQMQKIFVLYTNLIFLNLMCLELYTFIYSYIFYDCIAIVVFD